ncbi:MAG: hypothetical protein WCC17_08685 [Candidatus Nitrosopolaris sp.]
MLYYRLGGGLVEVMEATKMMKAKAAKGMETKATIEVMKAKAAVVKNFVGPIYVTSVHGSMLINKMERAHSFV